MIEKSIANRVMEKGLSTGGDFCEIFMEDTESNRVVLQDGKIESSVYSRIYGAGVRVFSGTRSIYAYSADTSEKALLETASAAADALNGAPGQKLEAFRAGAVFAPPKMPFSAVDNGKRAGLLKEAYSACRDYSAEITSIGARYVDADQRVLICNSMGVWAEDRRPRVRISVSAVAQKDGETQDGLGTAGMGMGFEAFEVIDVAETAKEAAKTAVTMLHGQPCPAGTMPVVISGGFGGVILHEACVHSLEATSVGLNNSEFCGKLGQKVAGDIVTVVDDGTMPGEWGSINIDDEGTPSKRNVLIENGVLKSYLVDMLGSRRMDNCALTGSSRRQDYTFAPTSRMTNTFFAPHTDDEDEMIRTMGDGLYAAKMGGGSVNPLTGEFNFFVEEGYWVKDGKIYCPVRGATLIGKGSEVLRRVDRIGRTMWMSTGMCGSLSGSVPTNVGQPRIRVSEMIVGGKGGKL